MRIADGMRKYRSDLKEYKISFGIDREFLTDRARSICQIAGIATDINQIAHLCR